MKIFANLFLLTLLGCIHPTPGPVPPTPDAMTDAAIPAAPTCAFNIKATLEGICPDIFTPAGDPCVVCPGGGTCMDKSVGAYCVTSTCLAALRDGSCTKVQDPSALLQSKKTTVKNKLQPKTH